MILISLLISVLWSDPTEIAKINSIKSEAEKAFLDSNYDLAIEKYRYLLDSLGLDESELKLNLAHSFYQKGDTAISKEKYYGLATDQNKNYRSVAQQQLGILAKNQNQLEKSLQHLKASIKANPLNEEARYNYEVVKKLLENQQNQDQNQDEQDQENQDQENQEEQDQENQNQENQDQQGQDQENQDQQNQDQNQDEQNQDQQEQESKEGEEGEQSEEQQQQGEEQKEDEAQEQPNPSTQEKLQEMNISEEKARMILEAMKNNEIQYLQQQKRKPTKQSDSGKPDW